MIICVREHLFYSYFNYQCEDIAVLLKVNIVCTVVVVIPTPNKINICSRRSDADETNDNIILTLARLLCKMY